MLVGMALYVRLLVYAGLSLFIINGLYIYMVVCIVYAYNLTIMDSFENEDEEKIIGTIVKIDSEGLHGISDSLPRITLKDSGVNPSTVSNQGNTSLTTVLDRVTISPKSTNTNGTIASKDTYETCSQKEVSGVTPANVNLEGVPMLEGLTPVSQTISEPNKCVLKETVLIHLTNVDPTEGTMTLDGVTGIHTPKQSTSGSQSNTDSHLVTSETNNQGNVNVTPPVISTLDGVTEIPATNKVTPAQHCQLHQH